MKKGTDSSPEKLNGPPTEKIPKKSPKKDHMSGQESLVSSTDSKRKGPMVPIGGFSVRPDSGERG